MAFYKVEVEVKNEVLGLEDLDAMAMAEFDAEGKVDFNLDEATVDKIIGKEAYCGGDIPDDVMEKLESALSGSNSNSYFWTNLEKAKSFIEKLNELGIEANLSQETEMDWNAEWRKGFRKIEVESDLAVVPSWEKEDPDFEKVFIYPGMGFGTGNHETTFLCLKLFREIRKNLKTSGTCLDFGCGSGILGIAAMKQLKSVVDFVDIDENALDNCLVNLNHNDYSDYSEGHGLILRDRFVSEKKYELVFANILENILELEQDVIINSVQKDGYLIVSGLLKGQEDNIIEKYNSLKFLKVVEKGDWVAVLFQA